jgi:ATP-dependent DNA helicase RecG
VAREPLSVGDWAARARALPFEPTEEQLQAAETTVAMLTSREVGRQLLTGDVGTGKTAAYGLGVAACVDAGGRAAVLLPGTALARQVFEELSGWWPDLGAVLVTASTGNIPAEARLLVGTTALLHRAADLHFDLIVADEQHRYSVEQRTRLAKAHTHLLEVSATPIPRSQARAQFGFVRVSALTQGHVAKDIRTRIWQPGERRALFQAIEATIAEGMQVLVVYPLKYGKSGKEDKESVSGVVGQWEARFPGVVTHVHGAMDDEQKTEAIDSVRRADRQVLVATTVAQEGLNLPGLRRVVVVSPDRLGLSQLHQLRGRAARTGGIGWFDMALQKAAAAKTLDRLAVLCRTQDGFEIAAADLEQRGCGDLGGGSTRQHGAASALCPAHPVGIRAIGWAFEQVAADGT